MVEITREAAAATALWSGEVPTLADVYAARKVVHRFLPPTPFLHAPALSSRLGCEVYLKCENLQPTGAFKVRGGLYLFSRLSEAERARGVVAASTGNHGQSIAYAARAYGSRAVIFVPLRSNPLKLERMRALGAEIVEVGNDFDDSLQAAQEYAAEHDLHFIHSANEPDLIAGVGTYTLEMMEQVPELDAIFVPIGGGSGLCGACIVAKTIKPGIAVFGVQAEGAPAVHDSWRARQLLTLDRVDTFAEGLATRTAYALPAHILWDVVDDLILVSDASLRRAILTLLETTRMLAEGAGAAALAAAYERREQLAGKQVAVVLSGGNLPLNVLEQALAEERPW